MLKNISKLGVALNKEEQKQINGGVFLCPDGSFALDICISQGHFGFCGGRFIKLFDECQSF